MASSTTVYSLPGGSRCKRWRHTVRSAFSLLIHKLRSIELLFVRFLTVGIVFVFLSAGDEWFTTSKLHFSGAINSIWVELIVANEFCNEKKTMSSLGKLHTHDRRSHQKLKIQYFLISVGIIIVIIILSGLSTVQNYSVYWHRKQNLLAWMLNGRKNCAEAFSERHWSWVDKRKMATIRPLRSTYSTQVCPKVVKHVSEKSPTKWQYVLGLHCRMHRMTTTATTNGTVNNAATASDSAVTSNFPVWFDVLTPSCASSLASSAPLILSDWCVTVAASISIDTSINK